MGDICFMVSLSFSHFLLSRHGTFFMICYSMRCTFIRLLNVYRHCYTGSLAITIHCTQIPWLLNLLGSFFIEISNVLWVEHNSEFSRNSDQFYNVIPNLHESTALLDIQQLFVLVNEGHTLYNLLVIYHLLSFRFLHCRFTRPILHGLCTLGFAVRAIIKSICQGDQDMIKSISGRFLLHVYPGETLLTEMWLDGLR